MARQQSPEDEEPSAGSSTGSSTSSPYVAGAGPGFDPSQPPPIADSDEQREERGAAFLAEWEEQQVSDWLKNAGDLAHAGFGIGDYDWVMTQRDLERIAPPLTRILNRYEPTRAVAEYSDPAAVAIGFGLYGWRSALERIHVLRAQQAAGEGPDLAPGFQAPPPDVAEAAAAHAANGAAPGPGQPGHVPVTGPDGSEQQSWAEQLKGTRPPEADQ